MTNLTLEPFGPDQPTGVSVSDTTLLFSNAYDQQGFGREYTLNNGTWEPMLTFVYTTNSPSNQISAYEDVFALSFRSDNSVDIRDGSSNQIFDTFPYHSAFGVGLQLYKGTIAIGAYNSTADGKNDVYIYELSNNGTWLQTANFRDPSNLQRTDYGYVLGLYEDMVVVASTIIEANISNTNSGGFYFYQKYNLTWTFVQTVYAPEIDGQEAGTAIAIFNTRVAIATQNNDTVYIFKRSTNSTGHHQWIISQTITGLTPAPAIPYSLSMWDSFLVIGSGADEVLTYGLNAVSGQFQALNVLLPNASVALFGRTVSIGIKDCLVATYNETYAEYYCINALPDGCGVCGGNDTCDPCSNYGGTFANVTSNIKICNSSLAFDGWDNSLIIGNWSICDVNLWQEYATNSTPAQLSLSSFWIDSTECSNTSRAHFLNQTFAMNNASCYAGSKCCTDKTTSMKFAVCKGKPRSITNNTNPPSPPGDVCEHYGGTSVVVNNNMVICANRVAYGGWQPSTFPTGWDVCTTSQWGHYAPSYTGDSIGVLSVWFNNNGCSGLNRVAYIGSFNMNDQSCFNQTGCCADCCTPIFTTLAFAACTDSQPITTGTTAAASTAAASSAAATTAAASTAAASTVAATTAATSTAAASTGHASTAAASTAAATTGRASTAAASTAAATAATATSAAATTTAAAAATTTAAAASATATAAAASAAATTGSTTSVSSLTNSQIATIVTVPVAILVVVIAGVGIAIGIAGGGSASAAGAGAAATSLSSANMKSKKRRHVNKKSYDPVELENLTIH